MSSYKSIFEAIQQDDVQAVESYLLQDADINSKDANGGTPLHAAVYGEDLKIVEMLLLRGADINARDSKGGTPLHMASYAGNVEIIKLLLESGADPDAIDEGGWTPYEVASEYGHKVAAALLREKEATPSKRKPDQKAGIDLQRFKEQITQGDKLTATGKLDEAMSAYRAALRIKPCDQNAQRAVVNILMIKGEYEEAVEEYLDWARSCQKRGEAEEALKIYREILNIEKMSPRKNYSIKVKPGTPERIIGIISNCKIEIQYNMGLILRKSGSFEEAVHNFRACLDLDPFDVRIHEALGEAYMSKGMDREAVMEFQEVVRIAPSQAALAYERLGEIHRRGGKTPQGVIVWLRNAGDLYLKSCRFHDAARVYDKILSIERDNEDALNRLMEICEKISLNEKALQCGQELTSLYSGRGQKDKLVLILEKILSLDRKNVIAREQIIDHYRQILADDPSDFNVRHRLINILLENELTEQAATELKYLIEAYLEKGNLEEALSATRRLAILKPRDIKVRQLLGQLYYNLKQHKSALEQFRQMVKILREGGQEKKADELELWIADKFRVS